MGAAGLAVVAACGGGNGGRAAVAPEGSFAAIGTDPAARSFKLYTWAAYDDPDLMKRFGDISIDVFLSRLRAAVSFNTFMVGLIKAPFMALVIGIIATLEGLAVEGSAESLGRHVTSSVVKAIFMVIVLDGLFAMFFAAINY